MKLFLTSLTIFVATMHNVAQAQSTTPSPYCAANFDDQQGFPVADAIFSVAFGSLSNVTNAQYAYPHYVFYNNLTIPNFSRGIAYPMTLKFDVHGGAGYGVWIDYNHNNIFETSEKVLGTSVSSPLNISSNTVINQNITIPTSALVGNTRMRVRIVEDDNYTLGSGGFSILPCNASTSNNDVMDWGETEDYTINILASVGSQELSKETKWNIYPNPVTSYLVINHQLQKPTAYKIWNISGKEILFGLMNQFDHEIPVSMLPDGVYYFQLFNGMIDCGIQRFVKITK
jgi:hypothetical protein